MPPIPARSPAQVGQLPEKYDRSSIRNWITPIAAAIPPYTSRNVSAATTIDVTDDLIVCDATGGAFTVTLLPADQVQFLKVTIIRINGGGNAVTIGGTVSGAVNPTLGSQWSSITLQSDGIRWLKLAGV